MPRDLVFGNGRFYVAMDRDGLIREMCWPVIGAPNHLAGRKIRLGLRRDNGWFSWLGDDGWHVSQWMIGRAGLTVWRGFGMAVARISMLEGDCLRQRFYCTLSEELSFFHAQHFAIGENDIGDTCLLVEDCDCPESGYLAHFKGEVGIGFLAKGANGGIDQVACGLAGVMGLEGTWRDAEDGLLSGKPIEQGSVDSVFGFRASGQWEVSIAVGETLEGVGERLKQISPAESEDWAGAEAVAQECLRDGDHRPRRGTDWLVHSCEHIILANTGDRGQVVAAIDSDIMESNRSNYAYVWMRDAVLTAETMGTRPDLPAFVPHCDTHWIWQKYHPTGSRGSTWHPHSGPNNFPYQMDETALLVSYQHRHRFDRATNWLESLLGAIAEDGLPQPSWDLWEERFGVHFWTCATVAQAFLDAGRAQESADLIEAMAEHFHPVEGRIPRRVNDHVADASVLAGCLWCEPLRPLFLNRAVEMVEQHLLMATNCRGVARYEGDYYCRVRDGYPGNPWVICTMWLARAYALQGRMDEADDLLLWAEDLASPSGMLSEQYHPDTREPLSVCPLTWSHAEYLESARLIRG